MKIEYLRTAKKSFMIVKEADYSFENYELQMILHNDISCLLDMQIIMGDGKVEYWYDVTGMLSLEKQFSLEEIDEKTLRFVLQNLIEMKHVMEEYLLDDRNLCLTSSMIYYDRFARRLRFCYIPGFGGENAGAVKDLFADILENLNHLDPAAVRIGYDMYDRCMKSDFLVEDARECLGGCPANLTAGIDSEEKKEDPGKRNLAGSGEGQGLSAGRSRRGKREAVAGRNYAETPGASDRQHPGGNRGTVSDWERQSRTGEDEIASYASRGQSRPDYAAAGQARLNNAATGQSRSDYMARGQAHLDYTARGHARPNNAATGQTRPDYTATGQAHPDYTATGQAHPDYAATGQVRPDYTAAGQTRQDYAAGGQAHLDYTAAGQARQDYTAGGQVHQDYASAGQVHPEKQKQWRENMKFNPQINEWEEREAPAATLNGKEKKKGGWRMRKKGKKQESIDYGRLLETEQRPVYVAEPDPEQDYTECFSAGNRKDVWELEYKGDGAEENITLASFPFLVGTSAGKVQGLMHARTVSRVHARFFLSEGKLFVEDYNSTNGTYVNQKILPLNTPQELHAGDQIVFATEEYTVRCRKVNLEFRKSIC